MRAIEPVFRAAVHDASVGCGYDWSDGTEACLKAMRNRSTPIAGYRRAEAARGVRGDPRRVGGRRSRLDESLAANPTGTATEP